MTDARIVSSPPQGSGLTHGMLDRFYEDRAKGKPIDAIPIVGLIKVSGSGEQDTAKGGKRHVKLEFIRLEIARNTGDAEEVAWQITRAFDQRHQPSSQSELPLSNSPAEKRTSILADIEDYAKQHGLTAEQLDSKLVDMLGGPEHAAAEKVQDASLVHLLEYAGWLMADDKSVLIVTPEEPAPGVEFSDAPVKKPRKRTAAKPAPETPEPEL